MKVLTKAGCLFYALATIGIAIQQNYYGEFCPIFFPPWPGPIPFYGVFVFLFSALLEFICIYILTGKNARLPALLLGAVLLLMLLLGQVPWEFLIFPHKKTHLGVWALPLKELAWAGGAFCIAGIFPLSSNNYHQLPVVKFSAKLILLGPVFFAIMIILFGVCHLLYTPGIANMVPGWLPFHYFWVYFTAAALISAGVSIMLKIWTRVSSFLLGTMIFIWFLLLHAPNALKHPEADKGNLVFSALSALAFSGIAFIISGESTKQIKDKR